MRSSRENIRLWVFQEADAKKGFNVQLLKEMPVKAEGRENKAGRRDFWWNSRSDACHRRQDSKDWISRCVC